MPAGGNVLSDELIELDSIDRHAAVEADAIALCLRLEPVEPSRDAEDEPPDIPGFVEMAG